MGVETGIKWTDSTFNSWWGCTKVEGAIACVDCYAEGVDKRTGENHWGHGVPRRRLSEHARNEPYRWQRNADKFFEANGRRQRVFTLSMGDLFDKEVSDAWRFDHLEVMENCNRLEWQICTKRLPQIRKMIPSHWDPKYGGKWPAHVGVIITVVTQAEADRDCPRLLDIKEELGIPWVGISYEPAAEFINWIEWVDGTLRNGIALDWIIFGGKSGPKWNSQPFSLEWARSTRDQCAWAGCAFFMKQVAAFRPTDAMIPDDLMIRQWPEGH